MNLGHERYVKHVYSAASSLPDTIATQALIILLSYNGHVYLTTLGSLTQRRFYYRKNGVFI